MRAGTKIWNQGKGEQRTSFSHLKSYCLRQEDLGTLCTCAQREVGLSCRKKD